MSDENDEHGGGEPPERTPTGRKKRSDAGRPRGSGERKPSSRFERRAQKAEQTVRELIRLGKPDLDVEGLSFAEVVDRDAKAWGRFLAQVGEWFVPFGSFVDLVFGSPLVILLNMAPSFRAARRDLAERRERRAAERQRQAEDDELRDRIEADHGAGDGGGVFGPFPARAEEA